MSERILSVFIDESGDFGPYDHRAPYYLVSMVLHDQKVDITKNTEGLTQHLRNLGYADHAIHTAPLIRRESIYSADLMETRKKLFNALFHFARMLDFNYFSVSIKKNECPDVITMTSKLSKAIADSLRKHMPFFDQFDRVIVYYDNGQVQLTKIITSVFSALLPRVDFRKVHPVDYKLFQVADLICTFDLLELKSNASALSRSELDFFGSGRDLKKNYLKPISRKKI